MSPNSYLSSTNVLLNNILSNVSALSDGNASNPFEEYQANPSAMSVEEEVSSIFTATGTLLIARHGQPTASSTPTSTSTSTGVYSPLPGIGNHTGSIGIGRTIGGQYNFRPPASSTLPTPTSRQWPQVYKKLR